MRPIGIGFRLNVIVAVFVLAMALVAGLVVREMRGHLLDERKGATRDLVQTAVSLLRHHHQRALDGRVSEAQAKADALAAVRALRFQGDNYFWINDLSAVMVLHPANPSLEGRDMSSYRDPDGQPLFLNFAAVARGERPNFITYVWPKPGLLEPQPKLSYVAPFHPWGWVVGSGVWLDDVDALFSRWVWSVALASVGVGGIALLVTWSMARGIAGPLRQVSQGLAELTQGRTDVATSPYLDRTDEVGDLARALAAFQATRRRMEEARAAREATMRMAEAVFRTTAEAIMVTDGQNRIKAVNPAFTATTGYQPEEVLGRNPSLLRSDRHGPDFYQSLWRDLTQSGHWEGEIWNRRKTGEVYPEWLSISVVREADGAVREYVAVFSDITQRKRQEERIRWQAEHDALTDLPNRACFLACLNTALAGAARNNHGLALLFVDLDRFKEVNDTLGHAAGDLLLQLVAQRLKHTVRRSDLVARLGGDEFTVILDPVAGPDEAARVAAKVVETLAAPFRLEQSEILIGASVGVSLYPADGQTGDQLLSHADQAMYRAKQSGRATWCLFDGVRQVAE